MIKENNLMTVRRKDRVLGGLEILKLVKLDVINPVGKGRTLSHQIKSS